MFVDTLNRLDVAHSCDRQTDRQTNGRTDRTLLTTAQPIATRAKIYIFIYHK